jgi:2',3'-cyclic-nucleotide 2'-phosphodiesterase (5'-nucleotidase family)
MQPRGAALSRLTLVLLLGSAACSEDPVAFDAGVDVGRPIFDATDTGPARPDAEGDGGPDGGVAAPDATEDATVDAGPVAPDAGPPRSIVFVHTNDEHSHQLGFGPEVDDVPPAGPGSGLQGGLLRRSVVIERIRAEASTLGSGSALVSSGDQTMGSLFHLANPSRGIDYAIATLLGYDALTLGNHEFDFGAGQLASALRAGGVDVTGNPGILQVPVVVSNIRFSRASADDDTLSNLYSTAGDATHPLRRTFIKTHRGVRVGYLGLLGLEASYYAPFKRPVRFSMATGGTACATDAECGGAPCIPPATDPLAAAGTCAINADESDPRHFAALVADAAQAVAELRAQNVDLVVALAHVGVDERELATLEAMGLPASDARSSEEILLAKGVSQVLAAQGLHGLDLIVGGHSHTALQRPLVIPNPAQPGAQTVIVQAGKNGLFVGKVRLTQATPGTPWALDADYSGLEPVDDTVNPADASAFFATLVSSAIDGVVQGLESQPIASAGDGLIFPGEQCDGATVPNRGQCAGLVPGVVGGTLRCFANRQLDTSACTHTHPSCGNGATDGTELCDGASLGAAPSCVALGYASGTLACHNNCTYDTRACVQDFPSLLEVVVNFAQPSVTVRDQPAPYDLFFYRLGQTTFDLPEPRPSSESNLLDLVTDAERDVINRLIPEAQADPVRLVFNANGVVRDGIYEGRTGALTVEDLFRVLPLGISPVELTPAYTTVDFYLRADEVVRGLELGVSRGLTADDFWLGVSGARVEYDLARAEGDRIMRVVLTSTRAEPWQDDLLEGTALYDRGSGGFPSAGRLVHVATSFYVGLFLEQLGFCPRDAAGVQLPHCRACTTNTQCLVAGASCDVAAGRCVSPVPAAVATRTLMPVTAQELKEFLTLTTYVRQFKSLPERYAAPVPRRLCCVGAACPADGSRTCN